MTTPESTFQAIDFEDALGKVGGDLALLSELSELFRADQPNMLSSLRRAVAGRDGPSVRAAAHFLKGSLAVFSAKRAVGLAARLEDRAEAGQLDSADEIFVELETEVARVCGELQRLAGADANQGAPGREREELP